MVHSSPLVNHMDSMTTTKDLTPILNSMVAYKDPSSFFTPLATVENDANDLSPFLKNLATLGNKEVMIANLALLLADLMTMVFDPIPQANPVAADLLATSCEFWMILSNYNMEWLCAVSIVFINFLLNEIGGIVDIEVRL